MAENVTTPNGFFNNTIEPVFNEDIFSAENLSTEYQKPELEPVSVFRDGIAQAAGDKGLSLGEFDAAANLAVQGLTSQLLDQDSYTRSKRDLEFNINAERDVQFQQGAQLIRDIDAYTQAQRATVVHREYEKELKRQEELLEDEKKEALQLKAMELGVDPNGMSRKELRKAIAEMTAIQYKDKLKTSRMGKGGSSNGCPAGTEFDIVAGECIGKTANTTAFLLRKNYDEVVNSGQTNFAINKINPIYMGGLQTYLENEMPNYNYSAKAKEYAIHAALGNTTAKPSNTESDATKSLLEEIAKLKDE